MYFLVGGFNPIEKYAPQNGFIFPNFRGENNKKNEKTTYLEILGGSSQLVSGSDHPPF